MDAANPSSAATTMARQDPLHELLFDYNRRLPGAQQASTIPQTYCDSMTVREHVFVYEQKAVPIKHHTDADDARSYHWVLYASTSECIGTIRLIPFPHYYGFAEPGASYNAPSDDVPAEDSRIVFGAPLPKYVPLQPTSLYNGIEPFVKLGRLSVIRQFRGHQYADLLIGAALDWAKANPDKVGPRGDLPRWEGLVFITAQVGALKTWQRNGFVTDEKMGFWYEAGMKHVGMWKRLALQARQLE
ncbi:acetyltransferase [Phlyctema vagabunda]|uniref:Acetyltransferase n=1 Tax=Phlyctema vagabunda TaxID=108571 RepID=A0ABR4PVE7_9HELO